MEETLSLPCLEGLFLVPSIKKEMLFGMPCFVHDFFQQFSFVCEVWRKRKYACVQSHSLGTVLKSIGQTVWSSLNASLGAVRDVNV